MTCRNSLLFLLAGTVLVMLAATGGGIADEEVFSTKTIPLRDQPDAAADFSGRIIVATRLLVRQRKDGWSEVEVRGWHQQGAPQVLYALPGKRILAAVRKKNATAALRVLNRIDDPDTGITWIGASVTGWVESAATTADLQSIWDTAWQLFSTRCTVCHERRIPHNYSANNWRSLVKVMGPRTGLPKDDQRLILKYLQHHAKDMVGEPSPAN